MRRHDDELIELVCMLGKNIPKPSNRHIQRRGRAKTKQDHARVGPMLDEDQLPKITVIGDEHSFFPVRNVENVDIGQSSRVITGNSGDAVSSFHQVRNHARIGALVEQKLHTFAAARAAFLCGERR